MGNIPICGRKYVLINDIAICMYFLGNIFSRLYNDNQDYIMIKYI